jgi:hypothetical protein
MLHIAYTTIIYACPEQNVHLCNCTAVTPPLRAHPTAATKWAGGEGQGEGFRATLGSKTLEPLNGQPSTKPAGLPVEPHPGVRAHPTAAPGW